MQGHAGRPTGWLCRNGQAGCQVEVVVVRKANLFVCRHRLRPKQQRSQDLQAACMQAGVVGGQEGYRMVCMQGACRKASWMAVQEGAGRLACWGCGGQEG